MQRGFSLVELMVALLISLFMLIGVVQIFTGSHRSFKLHEGLSRVQENGRFAIEVLGRQIRMAGFRSQPLTGSSFNAIDGRNNVSAGGDDEARAGTDKLILRFEGALDGTTVNCLGNSVTSGSPVVVVFLVGEDRSLRCAVNPADIDKAVGQPLIQGVTDMQLLFGERVINTSTTPPTRQYRYVTADNVSVWSDVVSVRIELFTDSVSHIDPTLPDGRLVLPYISTVTLRNRL